VASVEDPIFGASWADDGMIYYASGPAGIWRVPARDEGEPVQVIALQDGESAYGPRLLPGGEWLLFTLRAGDALWNDASIVVQSLTSDARHVVVSGGTDGRWVSTGHVVYHRDGSLFAIRFDPNEPEEQSQPIGVQSGVSSSANNTTGAAHFDVSEFGTLVFVPSGTATPEAFVTVDTTGADQRVIGSAERPGRVWLPRFSPDGNKVAYIFAEESGTKDIWILDPQRETNAQLTSEGGVDSLAWSTDGDWIYYGAGSGG